MLNQYFACDNTFIKGKMQLNIKNVCALNFKHKTRKNDGHSIVFIKK